MRGLTSVDALLLKSTTHFATVCWLIRIAVFPQLVCKVRLAVPILAWQKYQIVWTILIQVGFHARSESLELAYFSNVCAKCGCAIVMGLVHIYCIS